MNKEILKTLLIIVITVCYFANLYLMFCYNPLEILIANFIIFGFIIIIILGFKFIDWLNY